MNELIEAIRGLSESVRYVATYVDGTLATSEKSGLETASSSESDKYEELIVNPTLLKLVMQRGNIDCGGMRFVIIRYGNFFQYVAPIPGGHVSVAIEASAEPLQLARRIQEMTAKRGRDTP